MLLRRFKANCNQINQGFKKLQDIIFHNNLTMAKKMHKKEIQKTLTQNIYRYVLKQFLKKASHKSNKISERFKAILQFHIDFIFQNTTKGTGASFVKVYMQTVHVVQKI